MPRLVLLTLCLLTFSAFAQQSASSDVFEVSARTVHSNEIQIRGAFQNYEGLFVIWDLALDIEVPQLNSREAVRVHYGFDEIEKVTRESTMEFSGPQPEMSPALADSVYQIVVQYTDGTRLKFQQGMNYVFVESPRLEMPHMLTTEPRHFFERAAWAHENASRIHGRIHVLGLDSPVSLEGFTTFDTIYPVVLLRFQEQLREHNPRVYPLPQHCRSLMIIEGGKE